MDVLEPSEIEALAGQAGLSMAEACRRAGISQSTFTRWKAGKTEPTLDVYRKLYLAVSPTGGPREPAPNKDMIPMTDNASPNMHLGVAEPHTPFLHQGAYGRTTLAADTNDAAGIFARIARDLPAEEARADRLLRLYNL